MFDRVSSETYNNGKQYLYHYDSEGSLAKQEVVNNGTATEAYTYDYDSLGRLIHSKETNGGSMVQRTEHLYDTSNRLTKQNWMFHDGASVSQSYTYDPNNDTLTTLKSTAKIGSSTISPTVTYSYNTLRQLIRKTTGSKFYRAYDYKAGSTSSQTTAQVEWMNYLRPGNGTSDDPLILGYKYAYNSEGNISAVYPSLSESVASPTADQTYDYDDLGQLTGCVDERNGTVTYSYTYDTAGNIKTMTGGTGGSKTLTYGDSVWKDRLTKVQVGSTSENITYETAASGYISGNPTSYYNGRHYNFTWQQGRQLATSNVDGVTTTYTYDMAGVRSSKTVGSTTYNFDTLSGLVVRQSWGTKSLYFVYDDANQPYCIIYRKSPSASPLYYYYALNLQGDVVGIINGYGTLVCTYSYDPWGAVTVGEDDSSCGIGTLNPLRYRGYYYDTETGLYYLQSRYYDPALGRFINADTFATTDANGFLSCNMFAYCENDPVNREDSTGEIWETIFDVASLGASIVEVAVNPADPWAWAGLIGDTLDLIPFVTGIGEITRGIKCSTKLVNSTDNVVDVAKAAKKVIENDVGAYEILFKSGKNYSGKGPFSRAIRSALDHTKPSKLNNMMGDTVESITWIKTGNDKAAFLAEYALQLKKGVGNANTYNKIWSPGKKISRMLK